MKSPMTRWTLKISLNLNRLWFQTAWATFLIMAMMKSSRAQRNIIKYIV